MSKPPTLGIVSLGCAKALVDTERLLAALGRNFRFSSSYENADAVLINTCGFIEEAEEESFAVIGEALDQNGQVIVMGCLGARKEKVKSRFPEVLAVVGPDDVAGVLQALRQIFPRMASEGTGNAPIQLTPAHYAYLKIAEGCNHTCTFCIIPQLRGPLHSRKVGDILQEAERLVQNGVQELLVIAQDSMAYGVDLRYRSDFWQTKIVKTEILALLRLLGDLGVWVRLHYVYPYPKVESLLALMQDGLLLPYLDMPLQHSSPKILSLMKRPAYTETMLERLQNWRRLLPDLTIRSTFIVGFPGETEEDFAHLLQFLDAAQLDRVGCFTYSPIEGAKANELPFLVPEALKEERKMRLMAHQAAISARRLQRFVGKTIEVMIDELTEDGAIGRSQGDAPEVDGVVEIRGATTQKPGQRVKVRIEGSTDHDLWGSVAS